MSQLRFEMKVGAFVLLGLVLLGGLVLLFGRGIAFYRPTLDLRLTSDNVGGIKVGSGVLLSGVSVGRVSRVELAPDGKSVTIHLKILEKYKIHEDALFEIEQSGFLGDQYIAIYPQSAQGRLLKNGDEVQCSKPFNMQETVAKAADTISKIGAVATNVEQAVSDVRRLVLTEHALKSFGGALERFGVLSSDALVVVSNLNALVGTNTMPVTLAVSNLNAFATELSPLASRATLLLSTNVDQISATVQNAEMASVQLTNLMNDLRGPQGLAGRLLNDQKMADDFADMAYYLAIATSNLNHRGLWGIMWRQKDPPPPRTHGSSGTDQ